MSWAALAVGVLQADSGRALYDRTKTTVEQWVETESLISKELNDWKKEEALLGETLALLQAEREDLKGKLEAIASNTSTADAKRGELVSEKESLEQASSVLRDSLGNLESQILTLMPRLPESFKEGVQPVLRRLPEPGKESKQSISHRMRNVVALLSQANKSDNAIALEREVRSMADGSSKEVSTLYFGFAIAYFTDSTGLYSGYGYPSEEGWKWREVEQAGPAILDAIAMYEKNKQAAFVELPVAIN